MRFKLGGDRRNDWRCFFCCHVRTGTIFLGLWHLLLHIVALSVIAVVLRNPEVIVDYVDEANAGEDNSAIKDNKLNLAPALPTPLSSEVGPSGIKVLNRPNLEVDIDIEGEQQRILFGRIDLQTEDPRAGGNIDIDDNNVEKPRPKKYSYSSSGSMFRDILGTRSISNHDLNAGIVVTFCTFVITLLMVYGAVRNKPSYLMPFFCLQVFDFCIACLTAVGYLCYLPDVRRLVVENRHVPFASQLHNLNPQCLSFLLMLTFTLAMAVKAYFIGVVWRCYKYLALRRVAQLRTVHFIDSQPEVGVPDSPIAHPEALLLLPDYETAISDPRYASKGEKKSLGFDSLVLMAPPPAYSSVVQDNQVVPDENATGVPEVIGGSERTVPASPSPVGPSIEGTTVEQTTGAVDNRPPS